MSGTAQFLLSRNWRCLPRVLLRLALFAGGFFLTYALPAGAQEAKNVPPGERRVALVIGNSAYPAAGLVNPVNDARDMAATLRGLGFEVIEKLDATQKEMNRAIVQFGGKLRSDTVALVYFAGHGLQVRGKNYLVPVDAEIASEAAIRAETVDVDVILDQLAVSHLNIVILDACRNNPFERRFRALGGGLAQMEAPRGSLIAYATAPGSVASDGQGRNGLYTQELLGAISVRGLPIESVFKRVRSNVIQRSGGQQTPWESSSLTGDFYFTSPKAAEPPAALSPADREALLLEQRKVTDRAVEEAVRRMNDEVAKERLALQDAMQKKILEALEKQREQFESQQRTQVRQESPSTQAGVQQAAINPTPVTARPASVTPESGAIAATTVSDRQDIAKSPAAPEAERSSLNGLPGPGSKWVYETNGRFIKGKRRSCEITGRSAEGVLESCSVANRGTAEWAYDGKPALVGSLGDVFFSPYLIAFAGSRGGLDLSGIEFQNWDLCLNRSVCATEAKVLGEETITVPAGIFETTKIQIRLTRMLGFRIPVQSVFTVWYAKAAKRLVKQRQQDLGGGMGNMSTEVPDDNTTELVAYSLR